MNIYKSKITFFFIYIISSSYIYSCSDTNTNFRLQTPRTNINLYLDLYPDLLSIGYPYYLAHDSGEKLGINNHGIYIIFNGSEYKAFDATCTYDIDSDQHILIPEEGDMFFRCPVCKGEFDIFFGYARKKPAKYPLAEYKTYYNTTNRTLRITDVGF